MIALTATATLSTRKLIMRSLEMSQNSQIIAKVTMPMNIMYIVKSTPPQGLNTLTVTLIDELLEKGIETEKTIVYCRSYTDIIAIYQELVLGLGDQLIVRDKEGCNIGRLVEKCDACTESVLKTEILQMFVVPNSVLRVIVATTAFGMGIDCPNVHRVFHWGPPNSISMYVQEVGRCGRDGKPSIATLYLVHGYCNVDDDMVNYCQQNNSCRREILMAPFVDQQGAICKPSTMHLCCDVCERLCKCSLCSATDQLKSSDTNSSELLPSSIHAIRYRSGLDEDSQDKLRHDILLYRLSKVGSDTRCAISVQISTIELLTGITDDMIKLIIKNHQCIYSQFDILKLCPSLSHCDAAAISDLIDTFY